MSPHLTSSLSLRCLALALTDAGRCHAPFSTGSLYTASSYVVFQGWQLAMCLGLCGDSLLFMLLCNVPYRLI